MKKDLRTMDKINILLILVMIGYNIWIFSTSSQHFNYWIAGILAGLIYSLIKGGFTITTK